MAFIKNFSDAFLELSIFLPMFYKNFVIVLYIWYVYWTFKHTLNGNKAKQFCIFFFGGPKS